MPHPCLGCSFLVWQTSKGSRTSSTASTYKPFLTINTLINRPSLVPHLCSLISRSLQTNHCLQIPRQSITHRIFYHSATCLSRLPLFSLLSALSRSSQSPRHQPVSLEPSGKRREAKVRNKTDQCTAQHRILEISPQSATALMV